MNIIILSCLIGIILLGYIVLMYLVKKASETIERKNKEIERYRDYYYLNNCWIDAKNRNKKIGDYCISHGYQNVILYGFSEVGVNAYFELKQAKLKKLYIMDRALSIHNTDFNVAKINQKLDKVDLIIITVLNQKECIKKELQKNYKCPIISLEDVIYSM